ncbi:MAG: gluconokinase [Bacteroidetes bacterium]|nr:gluconokinase [Bacteroidota bacterium]
MNIIAIDLGTTNCKAVIVNMKNQVMKTFHVATKPIEPKQGWNEQNPDEIFEAITLLLKTSISFCGEKNVSCVSFSCAMHSLLAVDKNGKPLMNMLTWADLRSVKYAHALEQKPVAKKIYQVTGVPIHAMSPLCKLIWMKHESKTIFNKAYKFISIKEYIFLKLFGKYIVDYSIAAATGFFDEKKLCWHEAALQIAGISKDKLSVLYPIEHYETEMLPAMQQMLKVKKNIPFVLGASDGALANIGSGIIDTVNAAVTVGTSGAVRITSHQYIADKKQRLFSYFVTDGFYITGGAINNGGVALQWLVEKIFQNNFRDEKQIKSIIKAASNIDTGANGLIFLPYIFGERSPFWDEKAKGSFIGLTALHTKAHITKAVLEGVCYSVNDVLKALEETCNPIKKIYLSGGIIQSGEWVQMLANITGKEILVNESADASALGAAFVGLKAMGFVKNLTAAKIFLKNVKTFKPDNYNHKVYKKYFVIYRSLYKKLRGTFDEIESIKDVE